MIQNQRKDNGINDDRKTEKFDYAKDSKSE